MFTPEEYDLVFNLTDEQFRKFLEYYDVTTDLCYNKFIDMPIEKLDYVRGLYETLSGGIFNSGHLTEKMPEFLFTREMVGCIDEIKSIYLDINGLLNIAYNFSEYVRHLI